MGFVRRQRLKSHQELFLGCSVKLSKKAEKLAVDLVDGFVDGFAEEFAKRQLHRGFQSKHSLNARILIRSSSMSFTARGFSPAIFDSCAGLRPLAFI